MRFTDLSSIKGKVTNGGITDQGILTSDNWNLLVQAAEELQKEVTNIQVGLPHTTLIDADELHGGQHCGIYILDSNQQDELTSSVGMLFVFTDVATNTTTQVLLSHFTTDESGVIGEAYDHTHPNVKYRIYYETPASVNTVTDMFGKELENMTNKTHQWSKWWGGVDYQQLKSEREAVKQSVSSLSSRHNAHSTVRYDGEIEDAEIKAQKYTGDKQGIIVYVRNQKAFALEISEDMQKTYYQKWDENSDKPGNDAYAADNGSLYTGKIYLCDSGAFIADITTGKLVGISGGSDGNVTLLESRITKAENEIQELKQLLQLCACDIDG